MQPHVQPFVQPLEQPLESLHAALWRASQVGGQRCATPGTGFAALDAVLPGGGWPTRALTELLLPHPGVGEMRLLAPALAAVQRGGRSVMLFDPPAAPCGWTLAALGVELRQLVIVEGRAGGATLPPRRVPPPARNVLPPAAEVLWALEQALKSAEVGAVVAWATPTLRAEALRRLQLAAQAHDGPAFLLREAAARTRPSAAPLRVWLQPRAADEVALHVVKRRGPPLEEPVVLALAPVLSEPLRERAVRLAQTMSAAAGTAARA